MSYSKAKVSSVKEKLEALQELLELQRKLERISSCKAKDALSQEINDLLEVESEETNIGPSICSPSQDFDDPDSGYPENYGRLSYGWAALAVGIVAVVVHFMTLYFYKING